MPPGHYAPMTTATATPFFTELAAVAGKPPEWIELFPKGPAIAARDGRRWTLEPARVVAAFAANQGPLAIDYEHGQALKAPAGDEAPAAGWITDVEERDGAVWGRVEWTAAAARKVVEREYRFISPDFDHTRQGVITHLNGAGLVNRPALVMTALSRQQPNDKDTDMSLKAIAAALGLADDADEKAVLAAISAGKEQSTALCALLKIDAGSDASAINAAVTALQSETETALASLKAETGHPPAFVLAADTVVAVGRRILPKAETLDDATNCLQLLSGRSHRVYSGICLITPSGTLRQRLVETRVRFKRLPRAEIDSYIASGEWRGKAGGYAVQGLAGAFVVKLAGSYTNVVGLPLYETAALLAGEGFDTRRCWPAGRVS